MRVEVTDFVAGAAQARGIAVVIDVFRAFSFAPYAVAAGARVLPVAGVEEALSLKVAHPGWLVCGERDARPPLGFDFGNSPHDITQADVAGRVLVHTTHSGTQGLVACDGADEVLTGSLVNAAAIVRSVQRRAPQAVTRVRMGWQARARCAEDDACASILAARRTGPAIDERALLAALTDSPAAAKFHDPAATYAPLEDLALCTNLDFFNFVLRRSAADAEGLRFLERLDV